VRALFVIVLFLATFCGGCSAEPSTPAPVPSSPDQYSIDVGPSTVHVLRLRDGTPCAIAQVGALGSWAGIAIACDWAYIGRHAP
jgi:hypothetical protein